MSAAIDVNVLLFASDTASPLHQRAAEFLEECAAGPDLLYLAWSTVMSYLRISTHPAIFASPLQPEEAAHNAETLLRYHMSARLPRKTASGKCTVKSQKTCLRVGTMYPTPTLRRCFGNTAWLPSTRTIGTSESSTF